VSVCGCVCLFVCQHDIILEPFDLRYNHEIFIEARYRMVKSEDDFENGSRFIVFRFFVLCIISVSLVCLDYFAK